MTTRAGLRTMTLQLGDAVASSRWDSAAGGEVDQAMAVAYDRLWLDCLNARKTLRVGRRAVTPDSQGRYALADLASGSGDSLERFYRVLKVFRESIAYSPESWDSFSDAGTFGVLNRIWYHEGDYLVLLPVATTTATIVVNHLPQRLDSLSADSVSLSYPSDVTAPTFDRLIALDAAANLLEKGGAESDVSEPFRQQAERLRAQLLQDVERLSAGPLRFEYSDSPLEWGG